MSLLQGYSSDEDDRVNMKDAFSLSTLTKVKKPRLEELLATKTLEAAPNVLSEVCAYFTKFLAGNTPVIIGSFEPNFSNNTPF